jgi:HK97 family phage portal protein
VIVRGRDGTKRELFALFDSSTPIPRPSQWGSTLSYAGERVTFDGAVGLPAFMRGVRLISETAAGLPLLLYRGYGEDRKPQPKAEQLTVLRRPNPDTSSSFAVWQYIFASLISGNAYLWKLKTRGKLKYLYPVNPAFVTPKYDGDRPQFELRDRQYGPVIKTVGKNEIIHIPGILLGDPYIGVSVVEAHRNALGTEIGRSRFEGRYLANDVSPGIVLKHASATTTAEQRDEIRGSFENRHRGQPGRPAVMWGGWELEQLPVNLQDAQFIESKQYSVQDIGRMLGIPSGFLNDPSAPGGDSPEQENMRLLQHGVGPWMTRFEQGLAGDHDLFPEPDWQVQFDEHGFLRADIKTRFDAYRLGRQGGWIKANEIRALEGYEPADGGDEIQQTPVGGAPNANATRQGGGGDADAE